MNIEIIGYLAAATISFSLAPQLIKSWKTKSTTDISITWTMFYLSGLILWFIYAIGISSFPLILSTFIESSMAFSLLALKFKYK